MSTGTSSRPQPGYYGSTGVHEQTQAHGTGQYRNGRAHPLTAVVNESATWRRRVLRRRTTTTSSGQLISPSRRRLRWRRHWRRCGPGQAAKPTELVVCHVARAALDGRGFRAPKVTIAAPLQSTSFPLTRFGTLSAASTARSHDCRFGMARLPLRHGATVRRAGAEAMRRHHRFREPTVEPNPAGARPLRCASLHMPSSTNLVAQSVWVGSC